MWSGLVLWIALASTAYLGTTVGALAISWSFHAGVALIPLFLVDFVWGHRRRATTSFVVMVVAFAPWLPTMWQARAGSPAKGQPTFSALVANTFYGSGRDEALTADIEATNAGLVALLEPPNSLPQHMVATGRWTVLGAHTPGEKWNIALMVQSALIAPGGPLVVTSTQTLARPYTDSVTIEADLLWQGRALHVSAVHAPAPTDPDQQAQRLRLLPDLAERAGGRPLLLLADLNATMASPLWRTMMQQGLRRPTGPTPRTWPSWFGPAGLSIDHALVTEQLGAEPAQPVWLTSSDHRGVLVKVGWAR